MKEVITQFKQVLKHFPKSMVYWANGKVKDAYKKQKKCFKSTAAYKICNVEIAWYKMLSILFDPSGKINTQYIIDLFNGRLKQDPNKK